MDLASALCVAAPSRAEQRRARVIATARRLFVDGGFHATGIAQIARESGIGVGQIYRDFASKEEIVAAIVAADCGEYQRAEELHRAIAAGDRDGVRRWLHELVEPEDDLEGSRLFAEIVAESSRNERIAAIFAKLQSDLRANMLAALALLAPGEALAEPRARLADAVLTMSLGMLHHSLMQPALDTTRLARTLQAIVDTGVAALGA
jgi:AcrR family transcriptional regulator